MCSQRISLAQGFDALFSRADDSEHPGVDELVRYQRRELDAEIQEQIVGHLARCLECAEIVLDLASLDSAIHSARIERTPSKESHVRGWDALRNQQRTMPIGLWTPSAGKSRWHKTWMALAASLLLGFWLGHFEVLWDQPRPVIANLEIFELRSETLRSDFAPNQLQLSEQSGQVALVLATPRVPVHDMHSCILVDQSGHTVWSQDRLEPTSYGTFTLLLSPASVPAGRYRIELYGSEGAERTRLASYPIEINDDGGSL